MKTVIKEVYYCDYCNKRYLSKYFASKHEKHCTLNPTRECKMCKMGSTYHYEEYVKRLTNLLNAEEKEVDFISEDHIENFKKVWTEISDELGGCPACCLAVLRQTCFGLATHLEWSGIWGYKDECNKWWNEVNEERKQELSWISYE
jgi:hypothetical protein